MRYGPKYLFLGSRLDDDTFILRAILSGLNAQAREWSETIVIMDNGTVPGLDYEVEQYRWLEHRPTKSWERANIVIAFMDNMRHCRENEDWLRKAKEAGIPTFIVSH